MENPETIQKEEGMFKPALSHSVIISAAIIAVTLIVYLLGKLQSSWFSWVIIALTFAGVVYALFGYRNQKLGGFISFGKAFTYGLMVTIITGVITTVFSVLLYHVISPELIDLALLEAEKNILRSNPDMPYNQVEFALRITKWVLSPLGMVISGVFGGAIQGVIFGLIGGLFVKKKNPDGFTL